MDYTRIFISHSGDLDKVERLKNYIENQDYLTPVLIIKERNPNELFEKQVEEGIRSCHYFVPILTGNSLQSVWVNQEIGCARGLGRQTYALIDEEIIDDNDLKAFIHKYQEHFIFNEDNFESKYIELIDEIKENEGLGEPNYLVRKWETEGDKAENPISYDQEIDKDSLLHIKAKLFSDSQEFVIYFKVGTDNPNEIDRYIGFSNSNRVNNSADHIRGKEYVYQIDLPGNIVYKKTLNIINAILQSGLFFETLPNKIHAVRVRNMNGRRGHQNRYYYAITNKKEK